MKRYFVKKTPDTIIHLQKALKANKNIILKLHSVFVNLEINENENGKSELLSQFKGLKN